MGPVTPILTRRRGQRLEILGLVIILGGAGLLRLGWPGLFEFKLDEARTYLLALSLAEFKALPLHATDMSVGLPNSPLNVYLYALPLLIWKSPLAATLFNGLLNTAAVALVYALVRRYWGARAALAAGLLYAAAPWAVLYSRKIWPSNLLPLFLVGYVFSGLLAFVEGRRCWIVMHGLLLSVVAQIHISSLALAPVTLAALCIYRKRIDWRLVGLAGLAGAALAAPFGVYALMQLSAGRLALAAVSVRPALEISARVFELAALVAQGTYVHALAGPQAYPAYLKMVPNLNPALWLEGGLLGLGAARLTYTAWRQRSEPAAQAGALILAWLALPLICFVAHVSPVYPHYLTIWFSVVYVLAGVGLAWLWSRAAALWLQGLAGLAPLAIAGCQVWLVVALFNFVGVQATPGGYGIPYAKLAQVAALARQADAAEVMVVSAGGDAWNDNEPVVFTALLPDVPLRFVDGRTTAVLPAESTVVILWPAEGISQRTADLYYQWGGGQAGWASVPLRAGEGEVRLVRGPGRAVGVPRPLAASAGLSNWVEILGAGGEAAHWELWWRAPGPVDEDFHLFAHVLDTAGRRVAQADVATYASRYWRPNDLVVSYFALTGAGATVRAGMYAYPALTPVQVLDVAGNPAGEWIDFPAP